MIWLLEISTPDVAARPLGEWKIVTWLDSITGHRALLDADEEQVSRLRQQPFVTAVDAALDDLYIDDATRNVWEVFDGGRMVRLVGYIPP